MKSIKKTFTMTTVQASMFDLNSREEILKTFDFGCKLSPEKVEKEIKKHCALNNLDLVLLEIEKIKDYKVTYIMPFNKFISMADKAEVSEVE